MPRPQDDRRLLELSPAEFARRIARKGIGGTDIGAVLGLSRWSTRQQLWEKKMGTAPYTPENRDMRRGKALERHAVDDYRLETGRRCYVRQQLRHAEERWAIGSPDRLITAPGEGMTPAPAGREGDGVLEVKCLRQDGFYRCRNEGIEPSYYCQLQWYMGIGGFTWGSFEVFSGEEWQSHIFDVTFDPVFFEFMLGHGRAFWHEHVLSRIPPDGAYVMPQEMLRRATGHGAETVAVEGQEWTRALGALARAREEHGLSEEQKTRAEDAVKALMQRHGHDGVRGAGITVTFRDQTHTSLDREALAAAHPDVDLSQFQRRTVSPTFRVTVQRGGSGGRGRRPAQAPVSSGIDLAAQGEDRTVRALTESAARVDEISSVSFVQTGPRNEWDARGRQIPGGAWRFGRPVSPEQAEGRAVRTQGARQGGRAAGVSEAAAPAAVRAHRPNPPPRPNLGGAHELLLQQRLQERADRAGVPVSRTHQRG